jgi:hypothetical protein
MHSLLLEREDTMLKMARTASSTGMKRLVCQKSSEIRLNRHCRFGAARCMSSSDGPRDTQEPTTTEIVKAFPAGVKRLYSDMIRYKNIHDASRTRLNAWTIRRNPLYRGNYSVPFTIVDEELRPGRIPRREHEEQRRLKEDLRKVIPVVALYAVPFVGTLLVAIAVLAPRQSLSRQFQNPYQKQLYAAIEYRQRQENFENLGEYVFTSLMVSAKWINISLLEKDAAGPILDLIPFYAMFTNEFPEAQAKNFVFRVGKLASLETYPREHLISLALANGLYQHLPDPLSSLGTRLCPWLKHEIRRIGTDIALDDALLLEEAYDSNGCESMTDEEVLDASLMRSLPVTVPLEEMRVCLTNHLSMIRTLKGRVPSEQHKPSQGLKLLTMHLSSIRYYLRNESVPQ